MKLNILGCRSYCERKGIRNYKELSEVLDLSVEVIRLLEQGNEIGYDAVKDAVAQEEVKKPFEHAERLTSLLKEQTELNAELDLNKREEVIISDDKDEGDNYMALPENDNTTETKPIKEASSIEKIEKMEMAVQPDYSIDQEDMANYGYVWRGMLPMRKESAEHLYKLGLPVYRLHDDDTEYVIQKPEDFHNERIFGIKKTDWKPFIESEMGKTYLATRLEICKAASEVVSEDLGYVDETFTIDFMESNFAERAALKNYTKGVNPDKRYVPDLIDEYTDKIYDDALNHYGWVKSDIPRAIVNRIENAELKGETYHNASDELYEAVTKDMNTDEFREFAGLEPINYKERVIEAVNDEFMKFQTETLAKSPEEIFSKNYEIHVKTELLDTIIGEGIK